MKRISPLVRTVIVAAGAAALAILAVGALLPETAEARHPQRLQQCRGQLRTATHELRQVEKELAIYKRYYGELTDRRAGRHHRHGRAMSRRAFSRLYQQFEAAQFGSSQIEVVERALRDGRLTTAQLTALLRAASFDSTRVDIAVMAHPYVVDSQNWIQIYDAFDFDSSKRRVDRKLGRD
jgi:hypothetical protein